MTTADDWEDVLDSLGGKIAQVRRDADDRVVEVRDVRAPLRLDGTGRLAAGFSLAGNRTRVPMKIKSALETNNRLTRCDRSGEPIEVVDLPPGTPLQDINELTSAQINQLFVDFGKAPQ